MDARRRRLLMVGAALVATAAVAGALVWLVSPGAVPTMAAPTPDAVAELAPAPTPAAEGAPARAEAKELAAPSKDVASREPAPPMILERFGARRASCAGFCDREAQCGFRTFDDCSAQSCEGELRKLSSSDFRFAEVATCAAAAAVPCDEACWKRGECAGDHRADKGCAKACRTLVKQLPLETYRESRCAIERSCDELPLCSER